MNSGDISIPQDDESILEERSLDSFIKIENVTKIYSADGVETRALTGIQLSIARGEYIALCGPSGCGKSTLLSILGLLDSPTTGSYVLDGRDTSKLSYSQLAMIRNREIGFVFQSFNLIEEMTVYENIALPLSYRRGMGTKELRERIHETLGRVGMDHRAAHYPGQLSRGEQQRVAIARALAGSPSILLADEPTGNLDSQNGDAVMRLLEEAHMNGTTTCIVTHDLRFAQCAERQISLFDGKLRA